MRAKIGDSYTILEKTATAGHSFYKSLLEQLNYSGSLSERQAECVAKLVFGRRAKANGGQFDELCAKLSRL